jgi:hypothetical protein
MNSEEHVDKWRNALGSPTEKQPLKSKKLNMERSMHVLTMLYHGVANALINVILSAEISSFFLKPMHVLHPHVHAVPESSILMQISSCCLPVALSFCIASQLLHPFFAKSSSIFRLNHFRYFDTSCFLILRRAWVLRFDLCFLVVRVAFIYCTTVHLSHPLVAKSSIIFFV